MADLPLSGFTLVPVRLKGRDFQTVPLGELIEALVTARYRLMLPLSTPVIVYSGEGVHALQSIGSMGSPPEFQEVVALVGEALPYGVRVEKTTMIESVTGETITDP